LSSADRVLGELHDRAGGLVADAVDVDTDGCD